MLNYKDFLETYFKYDQECMKIFLILKNKIPYIIECPESAIYDKIYFDYFNENEITFSYVPEPCESSDRCFINIPSNILFNDEKINDYIQSLIKK